MAFEALSDRLQGIFKKIRGQSELTEKNMEEVTQEIYVALLEADVNVKVAREFVARLKTKIVGMKVLPTLTPSQMVVKLVNEELNLTEDIFLQLANASAATTDMPSISVHFP